MAKIKECMYICTNNNNPIVDSIFKRFDKIFCGEYILTKLSMKKVFNFTRRKDINATFICIDSLGNRDNEQIFQMLGSYYKNIDASNIKIYFLNTDDINTSDKEIKYCDKIKRWLEIRNQEMKKNV